MPRHGSVARGLAGDPVRVPSAWISRGGRQVAYLTGVAVCGATGAVTTAAHLLAELST